VRERLATVVCLLSALVLLVACAGDQEVEGSWESRPPRATNATYEGVDLSARVSWKRGAELRYWFELSADGGSTWKRATNVRERRPLPSTGGRTVVTEMLRARCKGAPGRCSSYRLRPGATYHYRLCGELEAPGASRDSCFGARPDQLGGRWRSFTTAPAPFFAGDFDTADATQFDGLQCLPERLSVRDGRGRFEVREGDREPQTGYEGRCEILPGPTVDDGDEVWQRFTVEFAPGFSTTNYIQFAQWHAAGGYGQAALAFRVAGGSHRMQVAHGGGAVRYWTGPPLVPGRSYDFVAHIRFDDDPDQGFVELWLDGRRQKMEGGGERAHGPTSDPCLASDCPSPDPSPSVYPKLGIYRTSSDTSTVALYADDFLLGREAGSVGFSP
jgi:hypothetical protein